MLDGEQAVRSAFPGDVFRGVALGVGGIGGDHRASQVHGA